jgi:hypothetical protein
MLEAIFLFIVTAVAVIGVIVYTIEELNVQSLKDKEDQ